MHKYARYATLALVAPSLFTWELLVWVCKQVVKLDGKLDKPLEKFQDWVNND